MPPKPMNVSLNLLSSLGFLFNFAKSHLEPTQKCKYLGFDFESTSQSIAIPRERRNNLLRMVSDFSQKFRCKIRDFASMLGSLVSLCPAVEYGPLYTKPFEREKYLAL